MSKIVTIGTAYIFSVSLLYLMGFWDTFNVNFLEYIAVSEVVTVALKSLVTSFGYMFLGFLVNHVYMGSLMKVGEGRDTLEGKFLNKYWKLLILPFVLTALYTIFTANPVGTFVFAVIFGPIVGIWLANQGFLDDVIDNRELRYSIIVISILILFLSYFNGFINASTVKKSHNENQVIVSSVQYTYIGKLGNSLFLYLQNSGVVKQFSPIPKVIDRIPEKIIQPTTEVISDEVVKSKK